MKGRVTFSQVVSHEGKASLHHLLSVDRPDTFEAGLTLSVRYHFHAEGELTPGLDEASVFVVGKC